MGLVVLVSQAMISMKNNLTLFSAHLRDFYILIAKSAPLILIASLLVFFDVGPASAQPAPPENTKITLLLDLLEDPDVRAWLEAKSAASKAFEGATPIPQPADSSRGMMSTVLEDVNLHLAQLQRSWQLLPQRLRDVRKVIVDDVDDQGGLSLVALIALFVTVGATASYLAFHLARPLRHWTIAQDVESPHGRLGKFVGRLSVGLFMLGAFIVGSAGAFLAFEWRPLLREIVLAYLTAAIGIWAVCVVAQVGLLPSFMKVARAREARALDISDAHADHWYRWVVTFTFAAAISAATMSLRGQFGLTVDDVLALVVLVDVVLLAIALLAVWTRPVAQAQGHSRRGRTGHTATTWLLTIYFLLLFLVRFAGAHAAFWLGVAIVAAPFTMIVATRAVTYIFRPPKSDSLATPFPAVTVAVVDRAIRLGIIVVAAYLLAMVWGLDVTSMAETSPRTTTIIRGVLSAAVVALGADFLWSITKAIIQHKIGSQTLSGSVDGTAAAVLDPHDARLRTLLPILQNIILAAILVMTVLTILASLGIQIGPLIAGAGVVGVAVGFGAQTIVKDVIAGVFYLLDDAFRIGEHISTGKFSGTVESFSLRSVKLRHHRGPIYTIPFGELGAVQNGSRDWSIEKFNITVGFDTDLELARKLIKKLGLELAEDPNYKPWIIEPLKLQGVQEFGEYGIILRIKATTRPGGAFEMKRTFLLRVREVFKQNGIEIPVPTVHIYGGTKTGQPDGADEVAAAQAYLQRKRIGTTGQAEET